MNHKHSETQHSKAFTLYALLMDHGFRHKVFSLFLQLFLCNQAQWNKDVPWNCSFLFFIFFFRRDAPMWFWIFGWVIGVIGPHVNMRIAIELT